MDAMGAVGEDTPEPSKGVEVVGVDVTAAATERLNPATTTERMLLRTARSLPKVRCATTTMLEVTPLPTAKLRYARSAEVFNDWGWAGLSQFCLRFGRRWHENSPSRGLV